jgi:hypothetical protein
MEDHVGHVRKTGPRSKKGVCLLSPQCLIEDAELRKMTWHTLLHVVIRTDLEIDSVNDAYKYLCTWPKREPQGNFSVAEASRTVSCSDKQVTDLLHRRE